ncbi:NUDIX hydrolase [Spirillospora sp. NPDC127200]
MDDHALAGAARDYETLPADSEAMIHFASTDLTTRRLTRENMRPPPVPGSRGRGIPGPERPGGHWENGETLAQTALRETVRNSAATR